MEPPTSIRVIGATNNERGDFFTRLGRDLFFSLGYDNLQLNVGTSGRELDIQGEHRFEPRRVVAECKAHSSAMGGGELNKFLGSLTRERKKHAPQAVAGYFVSLGGFTGTGIQQENESGDDAIILFDGAQVVSELQRGNVLVSIAVATERAGRSAQAHRLSSLEVDTAELIVGVHGYVWAIYFTCGKRRTHFVLIHADGTPLAQSVADTVIAADRQEGGTLYTLGYLAPPTPLASEEKKTATLAHYKKWLSEECGYIQLDGLPADSDLSATKLRLEKLFVPLKATYKRNRSIDLPAENIDLKDVVLEHDEPVATLAKVELTEEDDDIIEFDEAEEEIVEPIGRLLDRVSQVAILASPGGGKSTLLKRLATAFSFPERRTEVQDELPDRDWLPLYLRCRDLRDRSHRPVLELLHGIAAFASMDEEQAIIFRAAVGDGLRSGRALLLIDGLDEISEEGARRTFAQNLRTFVAMFPQAAIVITSRVAGFREVAGVVAGICQQVTLAPLDESDVRRLCISWHTEVVADTEKVRTDAAELASFIWRNHHIRNLVENPLLLTTLLVVKRSNGEIPPTRAALYSEAVRVLVRTWNVEGYAPLDEHETLARLSYVACAMTLNGVQVIGNTALISLLHEAGREMEAELQFAKVSPPQFIQRIEYRSSLLMQTGYQRLEGELQPVFEFRHLTFQEYLAARGFVSEQYPGRNQETALVDVLAPHIEDERWQEVIVLAAALAGRKADAIIKRLTATSSAMGFTAEHRNGKANRAVALLSRCLVEEVTITPATLRAGLTEVGGKPRRGPIDSIEALMKGKFGNTFQEVVEEAYLSGGPDWSYFDLAFSEITRIAAGKTRGEIVDAGLIQQSLQLLLEGNRAERIRATLLIMQVAYESRDDPKLLRQFAVDFRKTFDQVLASEDLPSVQAAAWALVWFGNAKVWTEPTPWPIVHQLIILWRRALHPELTRKAAWAFSTQPLQPRESLPLDLKDDCDDWLLAEENGSKAERGAAAITLGWYRRSPWSESQLAEKIAGHFANRSNEHTGRAMLAELGEHGLAAMRKWDKRRGGQ